LIESVHESVDLVKRREGLRRIACAIAMEAGCAIAQCEFDTIGAICGQGLIPLRALSGGRAGRASLCWTMFAPTGGRFLAGRSIWLDAVRRYFPDRKMVCRAPARKDGVPFLTALAT
jgi:tagatose 1,6-diphosphate aldolase